MMYAVYRNWEADGGEVLFVTADRQIAEDAVALAEAQLKEALAVPRPKWQLDKYYVQHSIETAEYSAKIKSILTVDPIAGSNITYRYAEVEIR